MRKENTRFQGHNPRAMGPDDLSLWGDAAKLSPSPCGESGAGGRSRLG